MTVSTQVTPEILLSVVPVGTTIKVTGQNEWNDIEVEVSHDDELTLLRLVQQVWGIDHDHYIEI